ncbi:hypothetical protein GCM10022243_21180 [Saccharothrix violaceirubra]
MVGVVYGFFLVESPGLDEPPRFAFAARNGFLDVLDDVIGVHATSDWITAADVRIEAWRDPPTVDNSLDGSETSERTVLITDGSVHTRAVPATEPEIPALSLGEPGWYHVRGHRRRSVADARTEDFLLRFWPSDTPAPEDRSAEAEVDEFTRWNREIRAWAREQASSE